MSSSLGTPPRLYEIRIGSHLDARWTVRFDGMTLTSEPDGTTLIRGVIADQAALHGVLGTLRDAGVPLLSITPLDSHWAPHD